MILGLDWLSKHKGLIDCAKIAVKLTLEKRPDIVYVAEALITPKGVANRIVLNQLHIE